MSKYKFALSEETSKQGIPKKLSYESRKDLYDSTNIIMKKTMNLITKIEDHKEKYPLNVTKSDSKYDDDPKLNDPTIVIDRTQNIINKMQLGIPMDDDDDDYLNAMKNLQVKVFEPTNKYSPIQMSQEDVQNYYNFIENEKRKADANKSKRISIMKKAAVTIISIGAVGGFLILTANLTVPASVATSMFESGFYIEQLVKNKTMITFKIFTIVQSLEKGPKEFFKSLLRETVAMTFLVTANSNVSILGSIASPELLGTLHIGPNSFLNYIAGNTIQGTILNFVNTTFSPIAEPLDLETQMAEKLFKEKEEIELTRTYLESGRLKFEKQDEFESTKKKQKWFEENKKAIIVISCASSVALAWLKIGIPTMQSYGYLLDKDKNASKEGTNKDGSKEGNKEGNKEGKEGETSASKGIDNVVSMYDVGKEWAVQTFIVQKLLGITMGYFNTLVDAVVARAFKLIGKDQNSPLLGKRLANYFRAKFGSELLHQLTVASILKNFFGFTFQSKLFPISQSLSKLSVEGFDFLATGKFDDSSTIKSLYDNASFTKMYNSVSSTNLQSFSFYVYEETLKNPLISVKSLFSKLTNFTAQGKNIKQPQLQQSQVTLEKAEEILMNTFGVGKSDPIFNDLINGIVESGGVTTDITVINALKQLDSDLRTLSLELNQLKSVTDYNSLFLLNINDHRREINDMELKLGDIINARNDAFKQIANPVAQKGDFQNILGSALNSANDLHKNMENSYKRVLNESKMQKNMQIKIKDMNEKKSETLKYYQETIDKLNKNIELENKLNLLSDVKVSSLQDLQGQTNILKGFLDGTILSNYETQIPQINGLLEKLNAEINKFENIYREKLVEQQKYIAAEYESFTGKPLTGNISYANAKEVVKVGTKLIQKQDEVKKIKNDNLEKSKELKNKAVFGRRILSSIRTLSRNNEDNKELQNVYDNTKANIYKIDETLEKIDGSVNKLDNVLNDINENINLLKELNNDEDIKAQLLFIKDDMLEINKILDNIIAEYKNMVVMLEGIFDGLYSTYYQIFANGKMPEKNKSHDPNKNAEIEQDIQVRATRAAMKIGAQNLEKLSEQLNDPTIKNNVLKNMANKLGKQQPQFLDPDEIEALDKLMNKMTEGLTENEKSAMMNCFEGDACKYMSGLDWTVRVASAGVSAGTVGMLNIGFTSKVALGAAGTAAQGAYQSASLASGYEMFAGTKLQKQQDLINEVNDWIKDGLVISYVDFSTVLANQFVKQLSGKYTPGEVTPIQYTAKFMNGEIGLARYLWNIGGHDIFFGTEYGKNVEAITKKLNK